MDDKRLIEYSLQKLVGNSHNNLHYFQLGNLPDHCPWSQYNSLQKEEKENVARHFVEKNFSPLMQWLPELITYIIEDCVEVLFLNMRDRWWVLYDMGDTDSFFIGAEPGYNVVLPKSASVLGWSVPWELAVFSQIHNGFGYGCMNDIEYYTSTSQVLGPDYILPIEYLKTPIEFWTDGYYDYLVKEQRETWGDAYADSCEDVKLENILFFMSYATGDGVGFARADKTDKEYKIVEWFHNDAQSELQTFFQFINQKFTDYFREQ